MVGYGYNGDLIMAIQHNSAGIVASSEVDSGAYATSMIVNLDDGTGTSTQAWYITGWFQFQNAGVACRTTYHTSTNGNGTDLNTMGGSATTGRFQNTSGGKHFQWSNTSGTSSSNMINGFAASRALNVSAPDGLVFMIWCYPHTHYGNMNHYGTPLQGRATFNGKWAMLGNGTGTDVMISGDYWSTTYDQAFSGSYDVSSIKFRASTGNIKGRVRCYRWGAF